eukprot:1144868-Pelagomonas_calceolata.AAC.1
MGIRRVTSRSPCLILVARVERGLLKIAFGARKMLSRAWHSDEGRHMLPPQNSEGKERKGKGYRAVPANVPPSGQLS